VEGGETMAFISDTMFLLTGEKTGIKFLVESRAKAEEYIAKYGGSYTIEEISIVVG
jgi:hypothetical protein